MSALPSRAPARSIVVVPLTLALGASVAWGASDFLGGLATRRLPLVAVLFGAQAVGLALAAAAWLIAGGALPTGNVLALATGAGLAELVGFALTTVLLARTVLHERLGRARSTGVAAVLLGVALLSAGQL